MKISAATRADIVSLLITLLLLSPLIFWGFDRTQPVIIHEFSVVPTKVHAGEKALRKVTVTRLRACQTDVDVILIDGARVRWVIDEPEITRPGKLGVIDTYYAPMIVPPLAAPGEAELRVTIKRVCNPVQHIWPMVESYEPVKFTILPKD
jgi:hypothetical protein